MLVLYSGGVSMKFIEIKKDQNPTSQRKARLCERDSEKNKNHRFLPLFFLCVSESLC